MAEFAQFTLDPLVFPGRVLLGEPLDQNDEIIRERWASTAVGVGPLPGHQSAVPAQDGARGDQTMSPQAGR